MFDFFLNVKHKCNANDLHRINGIYTVFYTFYFGKITISNNFRSGVFEVLPTWKFEITVDLSNGYYIDIIV